MPQDKKSLQDKSQDKSQDRSYSTGKQQMQQPTQPYDASHSSVTKDRASASNPSRTTSPNAANPQVPGRATQARREGESPGQSGRSNMNRSEDRSDRGDVSIGNSSGR